MEMTIKTLREMIVQETLILERMAYDQDTWQDRLTEYLMGAIREFYKSRLAEKNSLAVKQDIEQWRFKEVDRLVSSFTETYFHKLKGSFNKEKAYQEVRSDMLKADPERRRNAVKAIVRYYSKKIPPSGLIPLDDDDTLAFWNVVQDAIDEHEE